MNIYSFKDVVSGKRSFIENEGDDEEQDDDKEAKAYDDEVEGEEEAGDDKVSLNDPW